MAKPFRDLIKKIPKDRRAKIDRKTRKLLYEITLKELRQAVELTQQQLADTLKINQAAVSKMESQSDMYISTLRRFLEAMGAKLKIVAEFPDQEIVIEQFGDDRTTENVSS